MMAFRVLCGLAPSYLDQLVRVADLSGHRRLRSSTSQLLQVPAHRITYIVLVQTLNHAQSTTHRLRLLAVVRFRSLHLLSGTL